MKTKFTLLLLLLLAVNNLFAQNPHDGLYGPEIKRIEGKNNGNNILEITDVTRDSIITNYYAVHPVYKGHNAPVKVSVYNADSVILGTYQLVLNGVDSSATWKLFRIGNTDTVYSDFPIGIFNHQYISQWGLLVTVEKAEYIQLGSQELPEPLEVTVEFDNANQNWLEFVHDKDTISSENWIRVGNYYVACDANLFPNTWQDSCIYNDYIGFDSTELYESFTDGIIAPYYFTATSTAIDSDNAEYVSGAPISREFNNTRNADQLEKIMSTDIVFTDDKTKWTRCPVLEMSDEALLAENGARKQRLRKAPSVDKNGLDSSDIGYNATEGDYNGLQPYGMGWFPGYAIDLETGERLNMAFGENSWFAVDNGRDMLFNPSERIFDASGQPVFGGRHYIYVFQNTDPEIPTAQWMPKYDGGYYIYNKLMYTNYATNSINPGNYIRVFRSTRWVTIPLLNSGHQYLETDTRIRTRIKKPLEKYVSANTDTVNYSFPKYEFELTSASITGISENNPIELSFYIYPNPANETFTIEINKNSSKEKNSITIYDMTGRIVFTQTTDQSRVNISGLSKGIYTVRVNNGNFYSSKKVVVQ